MTTDTDNRAPVLVAAARTPIGRYAGALREFGATELGAHAIRSVMDKTDHRVKPDQVLMGNVVQAGIGQNPARMATQRAGLGLGIPAVTLNDVCLASITATAMAAALIRTGEIDSAVVGGFESMSRALHGIQLRRPRRFGSLQAIDLLERDGLTCSLSGEGMGEMSDAANARLDISREAQDEFAAYSHQRAATATKNGVFDTEITALPELSHDEGIRPNTQPGVLATLKPAFTAGGTITAGNASQMSDAGTAGLLTSRETALQLGLTPVVEIVGRAVTAGPDTTLHLKPASAAAKLLATHGLSVDDIGVWEINEAFASVVLASARELGLSLDRVNPYGGAIALGHPLGASGFRLIMTLANAMHRNQHTWGVAAICGGGGQGEAILLRLA